MTGFYIELCPCCPSVPDPFVVSRPYIFSLRRRFVSSQAADSKINKHPHREDNMAREERGPFRGLLMKVSLWLAPYSCTHIDSHRVNM